MDTWTSQPGYPLLTVTKINSTAVRISQKRFSVNTQTPIDDKRYTIPIRFRTNAMEATQSTLIWMMKDQESIEVDLGGIRQWFKFNDDQIGYYRVNYEPEVWAELATLLSTKATDGSPLLSTLNRAHLLNDVNALADGEYLSYDIALNMMDYLKEERNLVPWTVAISQMKKLLTMLDGTVKTELVNHFRTLSQDAYDEVKFSACDEASETYFDEFQIEFDDATTMNPIDTVCAAEADDAHPKQLLREKLVDFLCQLDYQDCLDKVKVHFEAYYNLSTPISPNVRQSVYYYYLRNADSTTWNDMFDRLVVETDPQEFTKILVGLTATVDPDLIHTFIERSWNDLKQQDVLTALSNLSGNPAARSIVWEWVRENWEKLVEKYTINERTLGRLIPTITARFSTQTRLDEV